ncbi:protein RMD5 homolog [Cucurbita maxima]|uniref:Protein RMD5 homolog n=1 Tax=Cucurbita maxima TaxID=3661 RepID=A0A6J1KU15_CUCMA|nr:protein RMD5 homolog [Cucurbita maxima]XP_023003689.1 protein RMD5 homolog [Cucurbita maxima]XP_023003690.1 protein RMD5 homolog [Cucurbita maxima]XP_023003691.1 protein RMD5 homolog [Cucurbita maxima]
MELDSIKDAFDRVTKKQKLSSSKSHEVVDQIHLELEQVLQKIQLADNPECPVNLKSVFSELKTKLKDIAPLTQLESTQKELNTALTKYPKLVEKSFNPDISKAYRNVDFDRHTVNQIIASHFYRQGMFELGDCFISEAGESESAASMRSPFQEMYQILEAMKSRNLDPALNWALNNSNKLNECGSDLLLKLHSMQFMEILQNGDRHDALKYARTYLAPLASNHLAELQKLMACLLWTGRLDCSPYSQSQLLSVTNWENVAEELIRQFCNFLGQSYESPLGVTVAAGVQGLPPLLKFMNVMAGKKQEWQSMKQLPVPVELGREFQFHSIFVCPVSKEQSTEENPPMLMLCGHVLCKQSIMKMSKNSTKSFKCPYCPTDIDATRCRQLYF